MSTCHQDYGYTQLPGTILPAPLEKPPFTLKEIRDAIPPHCFKRSLTKSFGFLLYDIASCFTLFYLSTYIPFLPFYVSLFIWPAYWYVQGMYFGGAWVLAHECGHGAFAEQEWINDTVGFVIHSVLLVPYFSWKTTHRNHHQYNCSCENDEIYQPPTRSTIQSSFIEMVQDSPLYHSFCILLLLTISWMPTYLIYNLSGPKKYYGKHASHFSPSSPIFLKKQWKEIILADIGFFTVIFILFYLGHVFGWANLFYYYIMPYMVLNSHLIIITFLQHTDIYVPHYRGEEWTWLRGALCTVDRSYGPWLDNVSHQIGSTHVVHHLFPQLPFYHALEATEAMSKVLGPYHLKDNTPIHKALWRANLNCQFIEDSGKILFFKKSLKDN